jgi:hypothetical protein
MAFMIVHESARRLSSLVLLAALTVSGCSKPKLTVVTNQLDGWTLQLPSGFVKSSRKLPKGVEQYNGPKALAEPPNIVIESMEGKQTPEDFGKSISASLPSDLILQSQGSYDVAGIHGYTLKTTRNKGEQTQRQIYFTHGGKCVILTLSALTKEFDNWDDALRDSLGALRWNTK